MVAWYFKTIWNNEHQTQQIIFAVLRSVSLSVLGKAPTIVTEMLMLSEDVLDVGNWQLDISLLEIWIWDLGVPKIWAAAMNEQVRRMLHNNEAQDKIEDSEDSSAGGQEFWFWLR